MGKEDLINLALDTKDFDWLQEILNMEDELIKDAKIKDILFYYEKLQDAMKRLRWAKEDMDDLGNGSVTKLGLEEAYGGLYEVYKQIDQKVKRIEKTLDTKIDVK